MEKKKNIHYAWIILIGMSLIMGIAGGGLTNGGGLFLSSVSEDLGIGMGSLTLYFSIASIATVLFLPLGGRVIAKYDIRLVIILAILMQGLSFAAFGFMNSVWGWYVFSVPMAIGGIITVTLSGPILINNWFRKKNGIALGLMTSAVGFFGMLILPAIGNMISTAGWRTAYKTLGFGSVIIILPVTLFLIRKTPEEKGLLPYGMKDEKDADFNAKEHVIRGVAFEDAKKSKAFYAMILFLFFMTASISFAQHIGPFVTSLGYSVEFSGQAMGYHMAGVFLGAVIIGFLTDKIGAKKTGYLSMGVGILSILVLIFFPEKKLIFSLAIGSFGLSASSVGTLAPLLTSTIFGNKEYGAIYSVIGLGLPVAATIALPAYGYIYELTNSYQNALYLIITMLIINVLLLTVAFKGKEELEKEGLFD